MRRAVTITAVTLTTVAFAALPAAAAEAPPVQGSAGCAEAAQIRKFLVKTYGPGAVGDFTSGEARSGPRTFAIGNNGYKASVCS
jgi:hypothetical protein